MIQIRPQLGAYLVSLCFASFASAAFPVVTHHRPLGATRGEQTTIVFHGERLKGTHQVLVDLPGIEIQSVKPLNAKSVEVTLTSDKDLQPGLYPVRLVTHLGVSNLRMIGIGSMPVVAEKEPNSSFDTPQDVPLNRTVDGFVDREDVDYYRVDLQAGDKCTVEIEGIRHGYDLRNRSILDPYVAILDTNRFELAVSDDSSLLKQDGLCSFTADEDQSVIVMVRDSSFLGRKDVCAYRLHVGSFPRPVAVIPSGGVVGDQLNARLIDVDGSLSEAQVLLPSESVDFWPVVTETDAGISPSPNWIRVSDAPVRMESEPNDNYRDGQKCDVPALLCGIIGQPDDFDCYTFQAKKGQKYRIELHARQKLRSPLDGVINLFGPDHKTIKSSDDVGYNRDGVMDVTISKDGAHTVRVYDHLRGGSPLHHYVISVEKLEPSFTMDLKEVRRDEAVAVPVPAGGHGAMVVRASRSQYNESIDLAIEGLPDGVTATTFPIPKGRTEVPVLLHASADAKPTGALFDVVGTGKVRDNIVSASLKQHHKLVLGQNRREMWGYDTDRAAMAICEPMPFQIDFVQPKTPVLRRGSKDLLVRITRDEGFNNTVYFKTLYYPPGVGVNNSRRIEKGKNEVRIPITANKSAGIGRWPMILQVSYGTSAGTTTVASPPIELEVQDAVYNFQFPRVAAEQGTQTQLSVGLETIREIDGDVDFTIVGLPNGVTSPEPTQTVDAGATVVTFPLSVAADAKPGQHKTINIQTRIRRDGEVMVQTDGVGEFRIDKPLPAKKAPAKAAATKPKTAAPKATKPLSRLEQLRQLRADQ
ncbi:MAG: pre-peptidase C-terminal domain-containing protein [Planctomycetota bacterium]